MYASMAATIFASALCGMSQAAPAQPSTATPPNIYTVTAYSNDCKISGLKVNSLNIYQEKVSSYCPLSSGCPNGTETVFVGSFTPSVNVPGGQDSYAQADGRYTFTVQHSHSIPTDAFPSYQGWHYVSLPGPTKPSSDCPKKNPLYNCDSFTGYYTYKLDGQSKGGIYACPEEGSTKPTHLYVQTPNFKRTDCVALKGLAAHPYTGINPPVWTILG